MLQLVAVSWFRGGDDPRVLPLQAEPEGLAQAPRHAFAMMLPSVWRAVSEPVRIADLAGHFYNMVRCTALRCCWCWRCAALLALGKQSRASFSTRLTTTCRARMLTGCPGSARPREPGRSGSPRRR